MGCQFTRVKSGDESTHRDRATGRSVEAKSAAPRSNASSFFPVLRRFIFVTTSGNSVLTVVGDIPKASSLCGSAAAGRPTIEIECYQFFGLGTNGEPLAHRLGWRTGKKQPYSCRQGWLRTNLQKNGINSCKVWTSNGQNDCARAAFYNNDELIHK